MQHMQKDDFQSKQVYFPPMATAKVSQVKKDVQRESSGTTSPCHNQSIKYNNINI